MTRARGAGAAARGAHLVLYSRGYCHLCSDMRAALTALQGEFEFSVEVVDVDRNPELEAQYGLLVPVLIGGGAELCHYHLDLPKVRAYLGNFR